MSKFAVFSGHCQLKNGTYTGASGELNETLANEDVAKAVDKWLKIGGASSDLFIIPRKQLTSKSLEDDYKLPKANAKSYDCIVEIHFNAFDDKDNPKGTECLYASDRGKVFAKRVNDRLDDIFKDREIKHRDNLYMLTKTKSPAIIVEVCFCDSASDVAIYNKNGADKIGKLIAEGLLNKTINATSSEPQKVELKKYPNGSYNRKAKVLTNLNVREKRGATNDIQILGMFEKGQIIEVNYCLNNWFSTWSLGKEGYVSGAYIELL